MATGELQLPQGDLYDPIVVASGGFGYVYKGRSQLLGTEVAWKVLHGMDREALLKEAAMMGKARYSYVVGVLSTYENNGKFGLVMEYMSNGSVRSLLKKVADVPGALRFQIIHQVALGMNYLHALKPRILHRDLKPDNVLLDDYLVAKLTDFGLSRNETSVSTNASGTLSYIPPEALEDPSSKPTTKFDVYSFAILTWSVLSGENPYEGVRRHWIETFVPMGHRPKMELVNHYKETFPQAIEMMEMCWDGNPEKRPEFSECKDLTGEMYRKYGKQEVEDARIEVLKKLKMSSSSSSQKIQATDQTDGKTTPDPDTAAFNAFAQLLNQQEVTALADDFKKELEIKDPKVFLSKIRPMLVEETPDLTGILNTLYDKKFIGKEARNKIRRLSEEDQVRDVVDTMMKQGQNSCRFLLTLLQDHHPSLMRKLQNV